MGLEEPVELAGDVADQALQGQFGFLKLVLREDGWSQSFKPTTGPDFDTVSIGCNQ